MYNNYRHLVAEYFVENGKIRILSSEMWILQTLSLKTVLVFIVTGVRTQDLNINKETFRSIDTPLYRRHLT